MTEHYTPTLKEREALFAVASAGYHGLDRMNARHEGTTPQALASCRRKGLVRLDTDVWVMTRAGVEALKRLGWKP